MPLASVGFVENLIGFKEIATWGAPGVILLVAVLAVSLIVLSKGADWLVEGAAQLAYRVGIPKIIVGATVVSLGTTSPEAAVSVLSAIRGDSGLALGNALGSVICNTGLIFGLSCLIARPRLPMDRFILNRHGRLQFGSSVLLATLAVISLLPSGSGLFGVRLIEHLTISRPMGLLMVILLCGYMFISVFWARQHPSLAEEAPRSTHNPFICLGLMAVGLAMVVFSAECLVGSAKQLCILMKVPPSIIAATVVAFGTSVPELMTALSSMKKGHPEILVGNIMGANILNVLFVVGVSATASPLPLPKEVLYLQLPVMLSILLLFQICVATNKKSFHRLCGLPLLLIYAAFIIVSYAIRQP